MEQLGETGQTWGTDQTGSDRRDGSDGGVYIRRETRQTGSDRARRGWAGLGQVVADGTRCG